MSIEFYTKATHEGMRSSEPIKHPRKHGYILQPGNFKLVVDDLHKIQAEENFAPNTSGLEIQRFFRMINNYHRLRLEKPNDTDSTEGEHTLLITESLLKKIAERDISQPVEKQFFWILFSGILADFASVPKLDVFLNKANTFLDSGKIEKFGIIILLGPWEWYISAYYQSK